LFLAAVALSDEIENSVAHMALLLEHDNGATDFPIHLQSQSVKLMCNVETKQISKY